MYSDVNFPYIVWITNIRSKRIFVRKEYSFQTIFRPKRIFAPNEYSFRTNIRYPNEYSSETNVHSKQIFVPNEYSSETNILSKRIFVWITNIRLETNEYSFSSFRTNIRIFGIFVSALLLMLSSERRIRGYLTMRRRAT